MFLVFFVRLVILVSAVVPWSLQQLQFSSP